MNNDAPIFDDTYDGPRWRYGLNHRPLDSLSMPRGFILFSDREHPHYRFGTVDYPRELSPDEQVDYQIVFVERVALTESEVAP